MRVLLVVFVAGLALGAAACPQGAAQVQTRAALPEYVPRALPAPPEDVPEGRRVSVAVSECVTEAAAGSPPSKVGPGIMLSPEMAMRAARTKVAYDEIRGLYEVDLRVMALEREACGRVVSAADEEAALWRERSKRSWVERNGVWLGIGVGVVVGAGTAVGLAAALNAALAD